jgi:hypothetical protein
VIEVQSDLGASLSRVEIEIRDALDQLSGDKFGFDAEADPIYRVPFSFRVARSAATDFVIKATGYQRDVPLTTMKMRVHLLAGQTLHRTLFLWATCGRTECGDGLTCNPLDRACQPISESSTPSGAAVGGGDAGLAFDAGAADGGGFDAGINDGGRAAPAPRAGQTGASGSAADSGGAGVSGSAADSGASGSARAGNAGQAGRAGAGGIEEIGPRTDSDAGPDDSGRLTRGQWTQIEHAGNGYVIWNNVFDNAADMTLSFDETAFTITSSRGSNSEGIAFPSVYVGSIYYMDSIATNLPRQVSAIKHIDLTFNHNAGSVPGVYGAIASLWLNVGSEREGDTLTGGYVEVWFYSTPPDQLPHGSVVQYGATVPGVPGTWDVWVGPDGSELSIVYVRTTPTTSFDGDLASFMSDAVQRPNALPNTWYVTGVLAGFGIESGGAGLHADAISIAIE